MALVDIYNLASSMAFQQRVQSALVSAAIAISNEIANEVQSLGTAGNVTGGTFTLSYGGQTTSAIAWNANAATVASALQALSSIGTGNVVCTGGPLPSTALVVTFTGTLGGLPLNLLTHTDTLTGTGGPALTVTRTSAGVAVVNHTARDALAVKILNNAAGYAQLMAIGVAADASVSADYTGGSNNPAAVTDAHITNAVSAMWNAYT